MISWFIVLIVLIILWAVVSKPSSKRNRYPSRNNSYSNSASYDDSSGYIYGNYDNSGSYDSGSINSSTSYDTCQQSLTK